MRPESSHPKVLDQILDVPLDGNRMGNYKPFDPVIDMLDGTDPHRAETLLNQRHGPALQITSKIRWQLKAVASPLRTIFEIYKREITGEMGDWLFEESVKEFMRQKPSVTEEYFEEANRYLTENPEEGSPEEKNNHSPEYAKKRVMEYLMAIAANANIF